ncbi:MAG: hypothetical protein ABIR51_05820 [Sphingomicrobium sp.]
MTLHRYLLLATALAVPGLAQAANPAPPPPLTAEHRLSDAEIAKVLEAAAEKREAVEQRQSEKRQIHGEVGFSVGTGGYSSVYGTAAIPILNDGLAIVSFDSTDFGSRGGWGWRGPR